VTELTPNPGQAPRPATASKRNSVNAEALLNRLAPVVRQLAEELAAERERNANLRRELSRLRERDRAFAPMGASQAGG
jgi:hypothetical protein